MAPISGNVMEGYRRTDTGIYVAKTELADRLLGQNIITRPTFYLPRGREWDVFFAAHKAGLPVLLKGPTGTGKTTAVQAFCYRAGLPLMQVTADKRDSESKYTGGPIPIEVEGLGITVRFVDRAAALIARGKKGVFFIDEVSSLEDTSFLNSLTDHRRILSIKDTGETLELSPESMVAAAYNPGYKMGVQSLTPAFKQRFVNIILEYPSKEEEKGILSGKLGGKDAPPAPVLSPRKITPELLGELVDLVHEIRKGSKSTYDIDEAPSTRLADNALKLIQQGIEPYYAVVHAVIQPLVEELNGVFSALDTLVRGKKTLKEGAPASP